MTEEYTEDELAYLKHIERIENIMVVLEDVLDLDVKQDSAEPRKYTANLVVTDLTGGQTSVAATRHNPTI